MFLMRHAAGLQAAALLATVTHGQMRLAQGLSVEEECIKQAEAHKCFMEARVVFHHSHYKSDKRRDGNNPGWGQMITVVLGGSVSSSTPLPPAARPLRQINY